MFSQRHVAKTYLALLHGHLKKDDTTVTLPIARDLVRRTRMTTRRSDGRTAVSHFQVLERLTTPYGPFGDTTLPGTTFDEQWDPHMDHTGTVNIASAGSQP